LLDYSFHFVISVNEQFITQYGIAQCHGIHYFVMVSHQLTTLIMLVNNFGKNPFLCNMQIHIIFNV